MSISSRQAQVESLLQLAMSGLMAHVAHSSKHRQHSRLRRCWKLQRCVYLLEIEFQYLLLHYKSASLRHLGDTLLRLPCDRMLVRRRLGLEVRSSCLFQRGLEPMSWLLVPLTLGVPVHEVVDSPEDILVLGRMRLQGVLLRLVGTTALVAFMFFIIFTRFSGSTHVCSYLLNS